jgi:hypothetical protein
MPNDFMEVMDDWDGYRSISGAQFSEAALDRAYNLLQNTDRLPPRRHAAMLEEAITTSDFPLLFGGILDRELLARYAMVVPDWRQYIKVGSCRDFRQREIHKVQGNENYLPRVAEKGEYLVAPMSDAHYHIQVYKHGRQFDISWEALINDDLGAFSDFPQRFANACVYTEAFEATNQICVAAGPNPLLFGAPIADVDGQNVTNQGVLALTIQNLEATLNLMAGQTDIQGKVLSISGVHLVIPKALEFTARAILTSAFVQQVDTIGGANANPPVYVPLPTTNVLPQLGLKLHINPLLSVIDTSGNRNGTWYLFADPSEGVAAELDFLKGHETPEICMKGSDKVSVSGAPLGPLSGDFASDNTYYRVRHVLGGAPRDPRFAYAQVHA